MKNKAVFSGVFALIVILSFCDYQFFIEGTAYMRSPLQRQAGHISILIVILPMGYIGWCMYSATWLRKLWSLVYILAIAVIGLIGAIQWKTSFFSTSFLDGVSSLRLFFCSPVPYFMMYVLHKLLTDKRFETQKPKDA